MRAAALLMLVLLSGCASAPPGDGSETASQDQAAPCIRGVLVDDQVIPVAGATVTVRETGASTTTSDNGSFCLPLPEGDSTLDITAGDRRGTMTCHQGGDEPDGCNRITWTS